MFYIRILIFISTVFFLTPTVLSQTAVGQWRAHFSYNTANQVVYADDKAYVVANGDLVGYIFDTPYAVAGGKLYSYSDTKDLENYSTLTGLSGHDVLFIAWCKSEKTLIIVYSDGNIDFLNKKTGLVNLPDFKNKSLTADKTIYGIRTEGNMAYLSTGVGLVVLNVSKREISETYNLNFSSAYTDVYDVAVWADSVVVATESGLYAGNSGTNLLDAAFWSSVPFVPGVLSKKIVRFNDQLFALANNGLIYAYNSSGWTKFLNDPNATALSVQDGFLFICAGTKTYMYNSAMALQNVEQVKNNAIAYDANKDQLYLASGSKGLCVLSKKDSIYSVADSMIIPNGPASNFAWNSFFKDGVYYSTTGGRWGNKYSYEGKLLIFNENKDNKDEQWSNPINRKDIESKTGLPLIDFLNLAIVPDDPSHYFITTWGEGLYEFRDSTFYMLHSFNNSPLKTAVPENPRYYVRVDGATFDKDGNLWMLNSETDSVLQILKPDGKWFTPFYSNMPKSDTWNSILFTRNHQVWINSLRDNFGVFVMDYSKPPSITSEDKTRWFPSFTDQDGISLSPWTINCITEDLNGAIWIGTVGGPIIANNPSSIFSPSFNFSRIKIPRNDGSGNADYLLDNVRINCITVDGGNRKWIGTYGDGVYLISADGLVPIHHFNKENSPLPSDNILSVAIHPETGEVFIGTGGGLVSYRSDATQGAVSFKNAYVFPNPVKPEYAGKITVTGLMEKTQVKITDLSGNVLVTGESIGGQFSWNGYTKQGRRAASGVYLVFCTSEDGSEYQACKFMIIN